MGNGDWKVCKEIILIVKANGYTDRKGNALLQYLVPSGDRIDTIWSS